jgi:hypothetical protein
VQVQGLAPVGRGERIDCGSHQCNVIRSEKVARRTVKTRSHREGSYGCFFR